MVSELRFETKKIRMADLGKESCVPDLLGELTDFSAHRESDPAQMERYSGE